MKKVIAIMLIMLVAFGLVPDRTDANPVLPVLLVPAVASLLVAAGVTFSNPESVESMARWFYYVTSDETRQKIQDQAGSVVNTVGSFTQELYSSVKSWVDSVCNVGSNSLTASYPMGEGIEEESLIYLYYLRQHDPTYCFTVDEAQAFINSHRDKYIYWVEVHYCYGLSFVFPLIYACDGPADIHWIPDTKKIYCDKDTIRYFRWDGHNYSEPRTGPWTDGDHYTEFYGVSMICYDGFVYRGIDVTGQSGVVDTPGFLPELDAEGKIKVGVPPYVGDLVGKGVGDITGSNADVFQGGLLGSVVAGLSNLYSLVNNIGLSLVRFFDVTRPINFEPIRAVTPVLTNKFPFSLPWDVKRAVDSLVVGQDLNSVQLQFYNPVGEDPIQFSLEWPEFMTVFALWVRAAFLIIFSIGLIYSTHKLLGGAK